MKRKFLEDLGLEKETIDKILDENMADIGKAKGESDSLKTKVDELTSEKESLTKQLNDRDKQLETLKKDSASVDDLKKKIEDLQTENKTAAENHEKELKGIRVSNAVDKALTEAKAKNLQAVRALLKDIDTAELLEDGTVKGLADQIKNLKEAEDSKFLFEEPQKNKLTGATPAASKDTSDGQIDTSKMTYSEMVKYMQENPNAQI